MLKHNALQRKTSGARDHREEEESKIKKKKEGRARAKEKSLPSRRRYRRKAAGRASFIASGLRLYVYMSVVEGVG